MALLAYSSDEVTGSALPHDDASPHESGLIAHSSDDVTGGQYLPANASTASGYVAAGGGTTYEDWKQSINVGMHGAGAAASSLFSATAPTSAQADYWQKQAELERQRQELDVRSMTPAGQQGREGSFWTHPAQQLIEAGPSLAVQAIPAMVGGAMGGPPGALAGAAIGGGLWSAGSASSDLAKQIMAAPEEKLMDNQDYADKIYGGMSPQDARIQLAREHGSPLAAKSAAIGAAAALPFAEVGGSTLARKIVGDKLVMRTLGGGLEGSLAMGGQGGAQTQVSGQAGADVGIRDAPTPEETTEGIYEGIKTGFQIGAIGAAVHPPGTQTGGENSVKRTKTDGYQKPEAEFQTPPGTIQTENAGPAPPASPVVDPAHQAALDAAQGKTPTPGVGEAQAKPVKQPDVVQPPPPPSGEAATAPPAGDTTAPPSQPPPAAEASPAPAPPAPAPTVGPPVPETEDVLRAQQAAMMDPTNAREAMVYPAGMKPFDITANKWRYGTTKLPDGRWVQYDTRGPRALTKAKIADLAKKDAAGNDKINELLQLGPVTQTEAVKQSVAGVGDPAVVTERARSTVPGEPDLLVKAAEGTTATAPAQVEALEATKTPGSTVQVETHEQAMASRLKPEPVDGPPPDYVTANNASAVEMADKMGVTKQIGELAKAGKTAREIVAIIGRGLTADDVRSVRTHLGIEPAGPLGVIYAPNLPREAAPPRVEPVKIGETQYLSVWDNGDGTYFKRYADGRPDEPIKETVAKLLTAQEAYKPQVSEAEKIRAAAQASAPPPVRRVLRSETEEEKLAAARQAEANAEQAAKVAAEAGAPPKIRPVKEAADIKEKRLGEEKKQKLLDINQVARDVANAPEHLPTADETLAAAEAKGAEVTGARKRIVERAAAMVKAAKDKGYVFMRPLRTRVGETNHPNEGLLLHEAELLARKKVPKTSDIRRFMYAENELRNNGEAGHKAVMDMRSQTGRDWAAAGAAPTKETAHEGVEGGEVRGIEHVETPDVATKMEEAKERVADEAVAKAPGEERKETPLQKQAREASERARARLEAQEARDKAASERPTQESRGEAAPAAPRAAMGFKVEARGRAKLDELRAKVNEKKPAHDADMAVERPQEKIKTQTMDGKPIEVTPLRSTTAKEVILKHLELDKYSKEMRPMISRLVDAVIRIAGDTPVHYLSHDTILNEIGKNARGLYDNAHNQIFLNAEKLNPDTALHEAFHGATNRAIRENPELNELINRLRKEMADNLPEVKDPILQGTVVNAFKNTREFLTYMMTNPNVQNIFKGIKISDELAKAIGIPRWRKATLWNGLVDVIRQALKMEPRDTSAIEAAMAITDNLFMARDPRFAIEAATRLAKHDLHDFDVIPERDQEAYLKTPSEVLSRVKGIDKAVAAQHVKDIAGNTRSSLTGWGAKLMSGTWLNDVHGHLFTDEHGPILKAINLARDRVSQTYHDLRNLDRAIVNRGYLLDRKYASSMRDYGRLLAMSVRYNIHADRDLPVAKALGKAAHKDWQRDKFGPEAKALYDKLPQELQERYTAEKKFYMDKQSQMARTVIDKALPLFEPPKGSTLDEVMERARNNDLTDDDWAHYKKIGADKMLDQAYRLLGRKDVYFYGMRGGDHVVTGHYPMPKGGKDTAYSGESLPDSTREFDTEAQAHAFVTGTPLAATTREVHYWTDKATGETKRVTADFATSDPGTESVKYRVSVETQHTRFADTPAEAKRNREAMEADGVENLSGVLNRRDERAWSQINSADQQALERRIANDKTMTETEKQHVRDATRQMMLSGRTPHFMERRDVVGGDFGSAQALDSYSRNVNQHMARNAHGTELDKAMARLKAHEDALTGDVANSDRRSAVANEMRDRVYKDPNMMESKVSPLMQKLYSLAFIDYLARPSFVFLQQTHNWVHSVPMMAGRFGMWKAATGQRQAMKDLGGQLHNLWEGAKASGNVAKSLTEKDTDKAVQMSLGRDPIQFMINGLKDKDEKRFLTQMHEDGRFQSTFDASMFGGKGLDRVNVMMQQFTHAMEANNRLSAALNAYRLEKGMHGDHAGAMAYANRVIEESHGVFTSTNIAPIFRNPVLRPFMQFHNQPMNLAMQLYRNMAKSFGKGEEATEARWTMAYQLGTAMALAGMGGMPMDIPRMVATATSPLTGMGSADYADEAQRLLSEYVGQTAANVIMQGLPGAMGPYGPSLGGRIGYDIGFLSGGLKSDKPDDIYAMLGKTAAGAPGSVLMDWLGVLQSVEKGDFQTASEKALPGFLKDLAKAYRLGTQGKYAGRQQIREASVTDAMRQLLGFSGAEEQRQTAGHYALQKSLQAEGQGKGDLLTQFAQGNANQGDVVKWNAQHRDNRITPKEMQAARQPGRTTLGVKVTPKNRAKVREYENAYQ